MQSDLLELKNLGKTSVRWLNAIGVHKREQLVERGPVETYNAVRAVALKPTVSCCMPSKPRSMDVHWKDLDQGLKTSLLEEAENAFN